jgi:uncharacterized membrane protein
MACMIVGIVVAIMLIGMVAKVISGVVYHHLIRKGSADPAKGQIISFIASFIVIAASVVIGGWIFLSSFRFER